MTKRSNFLSNRTNIFFSFTSFCLVSTKASSGVLKRMMSEEVELDTCEPPHQKCKSNIETKLDTLLKEYKSQLAQDETSISTTPLTKMSMDTGNSEPVSQKPYPITMKHYHRVKLLTAKVI